MMRRSAAFTNVCAVIILASTCTMTGCFSDPPPPDLTPAMVRDMILQKWSQEEFNHFRIVFHSDTVIDCGVSNDLWKLSEIKDHSGAVSTTRHELTEKGRKVLTAIDLQASGKRHAIVLKGPYRVDITSITDGSTPNMKSAALRWEIDWDKAPADLKVCLPRFELTGSEVGRFELADREWRFLSFVRPDDPAAPPRTTAALDQVR
jgi:hypothetical protein